ncbi:two-component system activity regulator YycH [Bacillus spongiae]|uniref:Two-component system activity regulator YycH n=2 Tax=Bacillus spongiae TaxID=2683610 RepID=A0ABU8HGG4_9BACI
MKYESIKSIVLTILVINSMVLTYGIWTYQPDYSRTISSEETFESSIGVTKDVNTLIQPLKILYHQPEWTKGTVEAKEINRIMREITAWPLSYLYQENKEDKEDGSQHERIEIIFPDIVPSTTYGNVLGFREGISPPIFNFDRIEVELDTSILYFITPSGTNYKTEVDGDAVEELKEILDSQNEQYVLYEKHTIKESVIYMPTDTTDLVIDYYTREEMGPEEFKNALFTDPDIVDLERSNNLDDYHDSTSFMRWHTSFKWMRFVNVLEKRRWLSDSHLSKLLEGSISYVNRHEGWTDDYRYFQWNFTKSKISFRLFHKDYPVFTQKESDDIDLAAIELAWGSIENLREYSRPYFKLGDPLEEKGDVIEDAITALDSIEAMLGDDELLQDVIIGYALKEYNGRNLIFNPEWYYRVNNRWKQLNEDELGGKPNRLE